MKGGDELRPDAESLNSSRTMPPQDRVERPKILPGAWSRIRQVLQESFLSFLAGDSPMVSSSISYYSLLSIFPMMLLLVGVSGLYIRRYELNGQLAIALGNYLPMKPDFIMKNLVTISRAYGRVTVASILILLWSSCGVFMPLEKALNRAWEVEKGRGWLRSHVLALEMAVLVGGLLMISAGIAGANHFLDPRIHQWSALHPAAALVIFGYHTLYLLATFGTALMMFILIFKGLPNRDLRLRHVLPSAVLTALLWEAARFLFTLLLPRFNYRHVYGSIGVLVALMTWVYISASVTLFGAHVSRVLYRTLRQPGAAEVVPTPPALQSAPDVP